MAFRWGDYVKVEESDWTDNFNLTKDENPIQRGAEEQIIPLLSPLSSLEVSDISFPFHASLFLMRTVLRWLSLHM